VQHTPLGPCYRQQHNVKIAGDARRGFEIIVQGNDGVAEPLAKTVDYANHAKRYTADPKAREDVEDVLAGRGGIGDADRFEGYHESFWRANIHRPPQRGLERSQFYTCVLRECLTPLYIK
jgi:hypothetical protein